MTDLTWKKVELSVILLLQFTAAVTGQNPPSFLHGAGDEVALSCDNVIPDQDRCDKTIWVFAHSGKRTKELITLGRVNVKELSKAKAGRLSVTANCSLLIRNVTKEDAGYYTCRQFISGKQEGGGAQVQLSVVVTMAEHLDSSRVILFCSVVTSGSCVYSVKWVYEGVRTDVETSQTACSAKVTFPHLPDQSSNSYKSLKCNVMDKSGKTLLSIEKTGSTSSEKNDSSAAKDDTAKQGDFTTSAPTTGTAEPYTIRHTSTSQGWWGYIIVAVAFIAITVVVVIRCKRTKGNKTHEDGNMGVILNSAADPERHQDTVNPEDGVCYASISHTKTSNSEAQILSKGDDDEGASVTYSTVKASSSSSAGADATNLYATVKKPA